MKTTLENLAAFHAVVESGGFSAAARRLDTTKSVISKRVADLERSIGITLLHRSTRHVGTTDQGAAYFTRTRDLLQQLQAAGDDLAETGSGLRGTLRIAAPMTFGTMHLARVLAPFLLAHPRLEVAVDLDDRRVDFLAGGYDLGIRIGRLESGDFVARKLAPSPLGLYASRAYLKRAGTPQVPEDLLQHCVIGYAYVPGSQALTFAARGTGAPQTVRIRPRIVVNNGEFITETVLAGLGISAVPEWMIRTPAQRKALVRVLPDHPLQAADIYAIYPRNRHPTLKVKLLLDHLQAALATLCR